jgi:hypothetical protein
VKNPFPGYDYLFRELQGKELELFYDFVFNPTAVDDDDGGVSEENEMIPRDTPSQGGNGTQRGGRRRGTGLRYLNTDMLSTAHQLASIADARVQPDNFRPGEFAVVVKLKFRGEFILWSLRPKNPNLETIAEALGDDETTWKGRDIELYVEEDDFDGRKQIRAEVAPAPTAGKKGK